MVLFCVGWRVRARARRRLSLARGDRLSSTRAPPARQQFDIRPPATGEPEHHRQQHEADEEGVEQHGDAEHDAHLLGGSGPDSAKVNTATITAPAKITLPEWASEPTIASAPPTSQALVQVQHTRRAVHGDGEDHPKFA